MYAKRTDKLIIAERIALFQADRSPLQWNPEEDATNNLLQISNQESYFPEEPAIRGEQSSESVAIGIRKSGSALVERGGRRGKGVGLGTQRKWRKSSVNYLSGEEVCVMKKEKVVHLSHFVVFDQQELTPRNYPPRQEQPHRTTKLLSGLRRRNVNFARQYSNCEKQQRLGSPQHKRVGSPLQRMNQSCELRRDQPPAVPISDPRATSPSFRNKKVINYFKYRLARQGG